MGQICFNAIIASLQNFSPITSSSSRPYLCEWNTETRKKEGNKYFNGVIKCAVQRTNMKSISKEYKKQYFFINEIGPCKMWLMWSFVRFSWALRFFIGKKTLLWDYNIPEMGKSRPDFHFYDVDEVPQIGSHTEWNHWGWYFATKQMNISFNFNWLQTKYRLREQSTKAVK